MKKIIFFLSVYLMQLAVAGQLITASGIVLDEEGKPVIGATVNAVSSGIRTITDNEGRFNLESLNPGDSILISASDYESKTFIVNANLPITVILTRKIRQLEEVVLNTGYQQIPAERATGSFTHISKALFNQQVSSDILSRLEAISSGLSTDRITGEQSKIQIRGISTIQGPREPLIIIDNFPYEGDINNINPNEVASITILKDAAASSIWGARAGNGVIVITTNKPRYNMPLLLQFNQNIKIAEAPNLYYMKEMKPGDYVDLEQYLFNLNYRLSDTASVNKVPLTPVYEILLKQKNGLISDAEAKRQLDIFKGHDIRNDFDRYIYKPSVSQQYYLSMQAGSGISAFKFSLAYDKTNNELAAKNDRINLRLENQLHLFDKMQVNTGVYLTRTSSKTGKPGYGQITTAIGNVPLYTFLADDQGNALPVMKDYRLSWVDTVGGSRLLDWHYYPLVDHHYTSTVNTGYDLLLNTELSYRFNSWLSANIKYQFEKQDGVVETNFDTQSYYTRNLVNSFTIPGMGNTEDQYIIPRGSILDQTRTNLSVQNLRGQVNVSRNWHNHELNIIGGAELRHAKFKYSDNRVYGYNPEILSLTQVDYANAYPNFITGNLAFIPDNTSLNDRLSRFVSLYANGAYTYLSRYTASFSARKDGSNLFGVNTNDKWQPLWSAGLSWQLSQEKFAPLKKLAQLQLRLTYGVSGNVDLSKSAITTISYLLNNPYTQTPQAIIDRFANPELQWEKSYMVNAGLDFSLLSKRLSGSFEFYHKKGTNLFGNAPIDYTGGAGTTITKNVAAMKGDGIDLVLNGVIIQKPFKWTMQLIYSRYKDRVTDYYLTSLEGRNFISLGRPRISGLKDKPVYSIFSYPWAGLDPTNGDPQGILDGRISTDYTNLTRQPMVNDLIYHGPALPVHYGSIGNSFTWKNLELSVRMMYKLGYYFRRQSVEYGSLFNLRVGHQDYTKRWQKPGDELLTDVPAMRFPAISNRDLFYGGSEVLVEKGDHLRLSYISFAYDIKSVTGINRVIKGLRLYGMVNNLGVIWRANQHDIDPDMPSASILPSPSYAIGMNASF